MNLGSHGQKESETQDLEGVLRDNLNVISQDPHDAAAHQKVAECYYALGEPDSAEMAAREATRLDPRLAIAHAILAFVLYRNGRREMGLAEAETAYRLSPNSVEVLDCYGTLLLAEGRLAEAVSLLETARELDPYRLSVRRNLSFAYRGLRDSTRYVEETRSVFSQKPSVGNLWRLLAAYQYRYVVPISILVVGIVFLALILGVPWLLAVPALDIIRGIVSGLQLARAGNLRRGLVHMTTYGVYGLLLSLVYKVI